MGRLGGELPSPSRHIIFSGCILKQVKILHKNALFLHKTYKFFAEGQSSFSIRHLYLPSIVNFLIRYCHWVRVNCEV